MVLEDTVKSVTEFVPINDRIMLLKLETAHCRWNIIQVYAPTSDTSDTEVEEFYNSIQEALKIVKTGEVVLVMGDVNAKIEKGAENEFIGNYDLGVRNERGDRLSQFCTENELMVASIFFGQHLRRLYTWKYPADNDEHIVRYQIDLILVHRHFWKGIRTARTYPGQTSVRTTTQLS